MSQLTVLPNQYFHKIICNLPCYLLLAIHSLLLIKTYGSGFFPLDWVPETFLKGKVRIVNELFLLEIKKKHTSICEYMNVVSRSHECFHRHCFCA